MQEIAAREVAVEAAREQDICGCGCNRRLIRPRRSGEDRQDIDASDGYCLSNNSVTRANRELSYPVLLDGPDNTLDIAFTWFRQAIKHVRIKLA